nr:glycosyltransferase 87 family protein [Sphingomonas telluris]
MRFWAGGTSSDFWSLWAASRGALEGGPVYTLPQAFPYPPHSLFLFIPFSLTSFGLGLILFNVAGTAFFACAAKPYLPKGFPLVFAVCSPATLLCLFFGQTSLVVGGLWLCAFRGRWAAVSALTFKPHMGLLSVFALKNRADVWRTAALALLLIAASMIAFGFHIWVDFANALTAHADRIGVRKRWLVLGVGPAIGYGLWGWALFAVAAAYLLSRQINAFTAATAALLISPYALHYDMPVACLGFLLGIYSHWETLGTFQRAALAAGFLSPIIVYLGTWWIPPILLWALLVQVRLPASTPNSVEPATV